jgi:hypothetical protein
MSKLVDHRIPLFLKRIVQVHGMKATRSVVERFDTRDADRHLNSENADAGCEGGFLCLEADGIFKVSLVLEMGNGAFAMVGRSAGSGVVRGD